MKQLSDNEMKNMIQFGAKKVDFSEYGGVSDNGGSFNSFAGLSLDKNEKGSLKSVGFNFSGNPEPGKFLMYGADIYHSAPCIPGVEILPLREALLFYPEIKEKYYFRAVDKDQDEFTRLASEKERNGYFIRVRKDIKVEVPLHTAMFMRHEMGTMCLHNIVVLEDGASLHLVTGCASECHLTGGLHVAVTENFIGRGARLTSTMIHDWGPQFVVRPRTATIVGDEGVYVSNYYSVKPAGDIQMNPFTRLEGKNSSAKYMTVIASFENTYSNIGGTVLMSGENSSAELISRAVNYGGTVVQTGLLIGAAKDARAHVDCSGLMLTDSGIIEAVPGLRAMHPDAKMSHEAAIGRINKGEVNYLQSKGLEEMQAVALIIRGFLDIGIDSEGLDTELEKTISRMAELSGHDPS
ncbi:MAG: SufD family Fe-S cluster assembly protein [Bacteroidales bacterium]|jgi:Fe-S cluster assembly scaffold protein SufB|nr:SufD family Fe-S cluster assembly protein [Bacteroidales bacterium]